MAGNGWLLTALRAINAGVGLDDLLRQLSKSLEESWKLRSIHVYRFGPAGDLVAQALHGINPVIVEPYRVISLVEDLPIAECARTGEIVVLASRDAVRAKYANWDRWSYMPEALICVPLRRAEVVIGVVALDFKIELDALEPHIDQDSEELLWIAELCQAAMARNGHEQALSNGSKNHNGNGHELAAGRLSERHLELLRLVCAGDTNRQIAKTLHLAESTVRYELSRLYSRLGVETRQQAAAVAHLYLGEAPTVVH